MFNIIIQNLSGQEEGFSRITVMDDWKRKDMAKALEMVFDGSSGTNPVIDLYQYAGSARVFGEMGFKIYASQEWVRILALTLGDAHWEYKTRKGYGAFIERLLALCENWELQQLS